MFRRPRRRKSIHFEIILIYCTQVAEHCQEVLGIECKTSLEEALDEVIPWIKEQVRVNGFHFRVMAGRPWHYMSPLWLQKASSCIMLRPLSHCDGALRSLHNVEAFLTPSVL